MVWKYVPNILLTHDAGYRHVIRMDAIGEAQAFRRTLSKSA